MSKKLLIIALFVTMFLSIGFAASNDGQLKFGIDTDAEGFDPNQVTSFGSHRVLENIYESLLQYDQDMNLIPSIAESYETPDPYTVIFKIRENVKFHDGTDLTVEDVLYTFNRIMDPDYGSPAASYFSEVESIKELDGKRVEFKLKVPMVNALLLNFAGVNTSIVSKEFVEAGNNMQLKTNGTGPFVMDEYVAGNYITLKKFDDYYVNNVPKLSSIKFLIIPEEVSRIAALRNGDIDLVKVGEPLSLKMLQNKFTIYRQPTLSYYLIGINCDFGPFKNPLVRRALNYAINRENIIKMVSFGEGSVTGVMNPSVKAWAVQPSEFSEFTYNPKKAKELLAEAGYPNGFEFVITTASKYGFDKVAQVIQAQLSMVGIKATIDIVEWGIFIKKWKEIDFNAFVSLNGGSIEPDKQLYRTISTGGSTNKFNYSKAEVDNLLNEGRSAVDTAERKEIYNELQKILIEDSPIIFLYSPNNLFASQENVKDFAPKSNESLTSLKYVYFE